MQDINIPDTMQNKLTQASQNEPMTASASLTYCQNGDTAGWSCGRATHIRNSGLSSNILVSTGGLGGDISHGCTFKPAVVNCAAIDAISVHRYASVPGQWAANEASWVKEANGKKVFLEEWGIDSSKYSQANTFASEVGTMNQAGLPHVYWQILPPANGGCSYDPKNDSGDHFGIFTNSGVNLAGPLNGATAVNAAQDWTGSIY